MFLRKTISLFLIISLIFSQSFSQILSPNTKAKIAIASKIELTAEDKHRIRGRLSLEN